MAGIRFITPNDYDELAVMVGELLEEIIQLIKEPVFEFDQAEMAKRAKQWIEDKKYWVFIARDNNNQAVGFVSLYESYALYAEGAYGTIPELYVRPKYRSQNIGKDLLDTAIVFARQKEWKQLEVTTPPLPEFARTLQFYREHNFQITGGRKLKLKV
ncbi:MAG: GNAT family N-acetyltransferase [Cocleimonas sp.]|nr:GNAT family N-acetyltransferase [Cocleimonas sp.]